MIPSDPLQKEAQVVDKLPEVVAAPIQQNPFGDFSSFEDSVDKMVPVMPDESSKKLFDNIEQKLKKTQEVKTMAPKVSMPAIASVPL